MPRKAKRDTEENPLEKGVHADDVKDSAVQCIRRFFCGRKSLDGRDVCLKELITDENVKRVLRTQFDDQTFDHIHNHCLPTIPKSRKYHDPTLTWEVHCLLRLLGRMRKLRIPKEFQPGLLLLYFKHCRSLEIPPLPLI